MAEEEGRRRTQKRVEEGDDAWNNGEETNERASLYTTLARFVCLRKSCFRRGSRVGGWMTEEGHPPPPPPLVGGVGEEKRSRREVNGRGGGGTVGLIRSQGWLAAATRSPTRGETRERREMGRNGRDITTPLLVIEIIRCLDTRPRLRLPSFSLLLLLSLSLSVYRWIRLCYRQTDKTSLKIRRRGGLLIIWRRVTSCCPVFEQRFELTLAGICRVFTCNELANDVGWFGERRELRIAKDVSSKR